MKPSYTELPVGYGEILAVDLQKNKKLAILINVAAVLVSAAMAVAAMFFVPISTLFDLSEGLGAYLLRMGVLMVGLVAYIVLHELVHGVTMRLCGTKKIKYGFTGLYAFAGSTDYYSKKAYILIALAPVVVWGVVLGVLCALLPQSWFWVVYVIQISNISGAAGDFYVTLRFMRLPDDILVKDYGVGMTVYSAK